MILNILLQTIPRGYLVVLTARLPAGQPGPRERSAARPTTPTPPELPPALASWIMMLAIGHWTILCLHPAGVSKKKNIFLQPNFIFLKSIQTMYKIGWSELSEEKKQTRGKFCQIANSKLTIPNFTLKCCLYYSKISTNKKIMFLSLHQGECLLHFFFKL